MSIDNVFSARVWIARAHAFDREALIDGIKYLYNCREVNLDFDGGVWIANPQRGRWLDDAELEHVANALRAKDI